MNSMKRKPLVAANIKMNELPNGALDDNSPFCEKIDTDVIVIPTFLDIQKCLDARLITGSQFGGRFNVEYGAFTGDISLKMLEERGVRYVLCGHSERRKFYGETNEEVVAQTIAVLEHNMHPIVCVGETKKDRDDGKEEDVISKQLKEIPLNSEGIIIAYEPVWAIGKDAERPATPDEAEKMHAFIRSLISVECRDITRILYGGSVKPNKDAENLIAMDNIDGFLVGGCSLKPNDFKGIVDIVCAEAEKN